MARKRPARDIPGQLPLELVSEPATWADYTRTATGALSLSMMEDFIRSFDRGADEAELYPGERPRVIRRRQHTVSGRLRAAAARLRNGGTGVNPVPAPVAQQQQTQPTDVRTTAAEQGLIAGRRGGRTNQLQAYIAFHDASQLIGRAVRFNADGSRTLLPRVSREIVEDAQDRRFMTAALEADYRRIEQDIVEHMTIPDWLFDYPAHVGRMSSVESNLSHPRDTTIAGIDLAEGRNARSPHDPNNSSIGVGTRPMTTTDSRSPHDLGGSDGCGTDCADSARDVGRAGVSECERESYPLADGAADVRQGRRGNATEPQHADGRDDVGSHGRQEMPARAGSVGRTGGDGTTGTQAGCLADWAIAFGRSRPLPLQGAGGEVGAAASPSEGQAETGPAEDAGTRD